MIASVRLASSSITLTASQRLGAAAAVPHGTQLRFVRSAACIGRLAAARAPHMPRHVLALALANCVQSYSCGDGSSTHSPGQWAMVTVLFTVLKGEHRCRILGRGNFPQQTPLYVLSYPW